MNKNQLMLLLIFAMLATNVCSQILQEVDNTGLSADSWSLQFGVAGNLSLFSFDGTLITAKKHFSNSKAIRFGSIISGSLSHTDYEQRQPGNEVLVQRKNSDIRKLLNISLKTIFLSYSCQRGRLKPYWGIGPDIQIAFSKQDFEFEYNDRSETREWSGTIGLEGLLGFEWSLNSNIGVFAEYSIGTLFRYTKTTNRRIRPGFKVKYGSVTKEFLIKTPAFVSGGRSPSRGRGRRTVPNSNPSTVRFGLSAYF